MHKKKKCAKIMHKMVDARFTCFQLFNASASALQKKFSISRTSPTYFGANAWERWFLSRTMFAI